MGTLDGQPQRVLITGGAGFIGSALARAYLAQGSAVTVVDSLVTGKREWVPAGSHFYQMEVGDAGLERVFSEEGPFDVVSHHAALKDVRKAMLDPRADADANILGTLNVLRCAADAGVGRFMYPSSAAIYGEAPRPTPETAAINPISPYGISKAACELYCRYFALNRGLPVVALRYSTVYGPAAAEESEAGVITIFARRMLQGRRPVIYGDGEQTRDFVHVDDVVRANLLAASAAPRPWAAYNVATGVETALNEVYAILARHTGFATPADYQGRKPGEILRNAQDPSLLRAELGWTPSHTLAHGLAQVVAAYQAEAGRLAMAAW